MAEAMAAQEQAIRAEMVAREQAIRLEMAETQDAKVAAKEMTVEQQVAHKHGVAAAKGGVNALTVSLAFEYAEANIRVNATAPGGTEAPPRVTPRNTSEQSEQEQIWYQQIVDQTKETSFMHRYGTLDEQASAILYLASDEASYITGTILPVAGGDCG